MPIFLQLTSFTTGDCIFVNISDVQTMFSMKDKDGTSLTFRGGRKIFVNQTPDQIIDAIRQFYAEM